MFKVVFDDLWEFLRNHFFASVIISLAYFVMTKILVHGSFDNPNPLLGYQFFYSDNFIANLFLFSVIISTVFLVVIHFFEHRRVDTNLFFGDIKQALPRFIFGGLFASFVLSLVFYVSFLFGKLNFELDSNLISVIRATILILGIILSLKSMILFFPVLYFEENLSVTQVFRSCVKRTSWRLVVYFLLIVIVLHWLGYMIYYIFDLAQLFKIMGFGVEDIVQAYVHVLVMLSLVSLYKNISVKHV